MIAGPQRIILYPEKGEIDITAGAKLYNLLIHHRSYTSAYAYGPIWYLWATKGYLGAIQQIYRHLVLYSLLLHQPFFQIKLRNKTGIDPLLVSSTEILCWQDPLSNVM